MKTLLTFVIFGALAVGQNPANQMTGGLKNGRFWASMDQTRKLYFVIGFDQARAFIEPSTAANVFWPDGATAAEVVKGVDQFYEDPANAAICIGPAMSVFYWKVHGDTAEQLESFAILLRREAAALADAAAKPDAPK